MARFCKTVPLDEYILDVLMRDLVGHDHQPAAYLVYLYLYGQAMRAKWRPLPASLRDIAESTGLSKSAVQKRAHSPPPPRADLHCQRPSYCRARASRSPSLAFLQVKLS